MPLSRPTRSWWSIATALLLLVLMLWSGPVEARRRRHRRGGGRGHRRWHRHHHHHRGSWWSRGHLTPPEDGRDWEEEGGRASESKAHMMLVMQWPESLCATEKRGCTGTVHPYLTMHGLWPTERRLVNCRADFDPLQLALMEKNLTEVWPSYFHRTGMGFWKHEYDKHGSCLYATIEEYFASSLSLHAQYSQTMLGLLSPSLRARPLEEWTGLIKRRYGGEPMVMCRTNWIDRRATADQPSMSDAELAAGYDSDDESDEPPQRAKEQLLVEVGLCFDKDGAVVDCPPKGRVRRCRRGQDVLLPPLQTFTLPPEKET